MKKVFNLICLILLSTVFSLAQSNITKSEDINDDYSSLPGQNALGRLSKIQKTKVSTALAKLELCIKTYENAVDLEKIAKTCNSATTNVRSLRLPDGSFRGAIRGAANCIDHAYLLFQEQVEGGEAIPLYAKQKIAGIYDLKFIPEEDRPDKIMDYGRASLKIAQTLAKSAGIK